MIALQGRGIARRCDDLGVGVHRIDMDFSRKPGERMVRSCHGAHSDATAGGPGVVGAKGNEFRQNRKISPYAVGIT